MKLTESQETLVIVGVSTLIGFAGEVFLYSMEESKGKKFGLHFPTTGQSIKLLTAIFVTALVTDYAVKLATRTTMSEEEKGLADLYQAEKKKIKDGTIKNAKALQVVWSQQ